jgi:hypothetical protein
LIFLRFIKSENLEIDNRLAGALVEEMMKNCRNVGYISVWEDSQVEESDILRWIIVVKY